MTPYARYANEQAYYIKKYAEEGPTYTDWPELDTYLNNVLKAVAPDSLLQVGSRFQGAVHNTTLIQALATKEPSYNAGMTGTGQMLINIGLLAEVESEAELATTLAHELAHFYYTHGFNTFLDSYLGHMTKSQIKWVEVDRKGQELEADAQGFMWLKDSPYNTQAAMKDYRNMQRQAKKRERGSGKVSINESTTHPPSLERLEKMNELYKRSDNTGKVFFQVKSEEEFLQLREQARKETLKWLLNAGNYSVLIERAFKYHVQSPEEHAYVYFLMEGLRRMILIDVSTADNLFYTSNYYKSIENGSGVTCDRYNTHLFATLDNGILGWSPEDIKNIKTRDYWQSSVKFRTNLQAFDYFSKLAERMDCIECALSTALFEPDGTERFNAALDRYLANKNVAYWEYADYLRNDAMIHPAPQGKLTVFSRIQAKEKLGSERFPILNKTKDYEGLQTFAEEIMGNDFRSKTIFLPILHSSNPKLASLLQETDRILRLSQVYSLYSTEVNSMILDPNYFYLFMDLGVEQIDFVRLDYTQIKKRDKSEAAYKAIEEGKFSDILEHKASTRYLSLRVSSSRWRENECQSGISIKSDMEFKFRDSTREQIFAMFSDMMAGHYYRLENGIGE